MRTLHLTFMCLSMSLYLYGNIAPKLRVGLFTDTHIGKDEKSCHLVKKAMNFFRAHPVDLLVNCGDIADRHYPTGYLAYRKVVNETFAGVRKPQELFVYAYHDHIDATDRDQAFDVLRKNIGATNAPYDKILIKDVMFLIFPQAADMERYEKTVAQAVLEHPLKPIFILDHVPPFNTVYNSKTWGDGRRRNLLEKYPTVIHISGHVHGSMYNELNIWQGPFTAVNVGSLAYWDGALAGAAPKNKYPEEVTIMEVYEHEVLFRRFSLQDNREISPAAPWRIPLPFNPDTAPYRMDYRYQMSPPPAFPHAATLNLSTDGTPFHRLRLIIPEATPDVFTYDIVVQKQTTQGTWENLTAQETFSNFYQTPDRRKKTVEVLLSAGFFDPDKQYRFVVTPVNFYGKRGIPVEKIWLAPEKAPSTVTYESLNPMEELPFLTGLEGGTPLKRKGDFYLHDTYNARLELPAKAWEGPSGTRFRFTVDLHTIQGGPETKQWTLVLRNPKPLRNANARIATLPGETTCRYVIEFTKRNKSHAFYLLVREGQTGNLKVNYVKIERLLP